MPRGGSENALFIFSCHPVCRSDCARCWICYTGMRKRAKILHVLQKQETKKDEFSPPLHLVVFLRSNPSCVFSPVLEWLLQNRSQNDVRIMVFRLVLWSARYHSPWILERFWIECCESCGFLGWPRVDGFWGCSMPKTESSIFCFAPFKISHVCLKWCCWYKRG